MRTAKQLLALVLCILMLLSMLVGCEENDNYDYDYYSPKPSTGNQSTQKDWNIPSQTFPNEEETKSGYEAWRESIDQNEEERPLTTTPISGATEPDASDDDVCRTCGGKGLCKICEGEPVCPECEGQWECGSCTEKPGYCFACGGKGGSTCLFCEGEWECESCGTSGQCPHCNDGVCPKCDGSTKVECNTCDGSGVCHRCDGNKTNNGRRCTSCNGTGDCSRCDGTKYRECSYCDNHPGKCFGCRGDGECKYCYGDGSVCNYCGDGHGWKDCDWCANGVCAKCQGEPVCQKCDQGLICRQCNAGKCPDCGGKNAPTEQRPTQQLPTQPNYDDPWDDFCDTCSNTGKSKCWDCVTGDCVQCGGEGEIPYYTSGGIKYRDCAYCSGGKCRKCGGTGRVDCPDC